MNASILPLWATFDSRSFHLFQSKELSRSGNYFVCFAEEKGFAMNQLLYRRKGFVRFGKKTQVLGGTYPLLMIGDCGSLLAGSAEGLKGHGEVPACGQKLNAMNESRKPSG